MIYIALAILAVGYVFYLAYLLQIGQEQDGFAAVISFICSVLLILAAIKELI